MARHSNPCPAALLAPGSLPRFADLRPHVRLSRQTVLRLEQAVRFGPRCTIWRSADVIEWLDDPEHYCTPWPEESSDGR
jgi:prophage regulatory protein